MSTSSWGKNIKYHNCLIKNKDINHKQMLVLVTMLLHHTDYSITKPVTLFVMSSKGLESYSYHHHYYFPCVHVFVLYSLLLSGYIAVRVRLTTRI